MKSFHLRPNLVTDIIRRHGADGPDSQFNLALRLLSLAFVYHVLAGGHLNPVHTHDLDHDQPSFTWRSILAYLGVNHEAQRVSYIALVCADYALEQITE